MRIAVVQFPGSNCERETMLAIKRADMEAIEFLWNESLDKLRNCDGFVIVGGFSYEDRSRAGIIAALDPVMNELKAQSDQGKPILGICNGAQILVESGLVPGLEDSKTGVALTTNKRIANGKILGTGFYNAWINLRLSAHYQRNAFTRYLKPQDIMRIPVAHAEGRFVMSQALWHEIEMQGLHVLQYCNEQGEIIDQFPVNPNGSMHNIAALTNKAGNVMAMMPHPERSINGNPIFQSMRDYIATGAHIKTTELSYYPRQHKFPVYKKTVTSEECIIDLIITDNEALTVQNTLNQLGIPVSVARQIHWEISTPSADVIQKVKKTGLLYNERKEIETQPHRQASKSLLVRAKEDLLGQKTLQTLQNHFLIRDIHALQHGVLWHFSCKEGDISHWMDCILKTNILFNPNAHDCYHYEYSLS